MKKLVFIAPHLSTGGMPQYLYKQIETLINDYEIYCLEWDNHTGGKLVVQRNKIESLLGKRLITIGENRNSIIDHINVINPDIIHFQEIPEYFMPYDIAEKIYSINRSYKIVETSHDSSFDTSNKLHFPDKFIMVSQYQINNFNKLGIPTQLVEYPIEHKTRTKSKEEILSELGLDVNVKHVINVGLFTPRKNQAEIIEYAKRLEGYPIQFHFIGNQADNFKYYWEPLMVDFPKNCKWWGERSDVDTFYQIADLFLFTSRGHETDKETMPLVIREAIGWKVPSLIYNLPVYLNYFDKYDTITYLDTDDVEKNSQKIIEKLGINNINTFETLIGKVDFSKFEYPNSMYETIVKYGGDAGMYWGTFVFDELNRPQYDFQVENGDVFVDLGANVGMSSRKAIDNGASEVHCFEPDPEIVKLLEKNVPTAKIYNTFVAPYQTTIESYYWPFNPENIGPKYINKSITFKEVLENVGKPIDYLKVDIEGFEENLFDNLQTEDFFKIRKIFIEHHNSETFDSFVEKFKQNGFDVNIERGAGQNYLYAKNRNFGKKEIDYQIESTWDWDEQKMYFSSKTGVNFTVLVSIKEYKSDSVIWAIEYDKLHSGINYWIVPIAKSADDYNKSEKISGVKICIYNNQTYEQIYEFPFFKKFVNMPTVSLSHRMPYNMNYNEFFVDDKYKKFLNRKFENVVDVGANVGVFTQYVIQRDISRKIICVECDPISLYDLENNYKTNPNVKIIKKALHTDNKGIVFYHSPENPVISSTLPPDKLIHHNAGIKGNVETNVETITIGELVDELKQIDLLKIDIEGGEYNIIENMDISLFSFINNIFIECHFFESDYREKYNRLITILENNGYKVEEYETNQIDSLAKSECIFATKIK